jgi:hypothetical protein
VAALDLPPSIAETLVPLQRVIAVLNEELATADDRMATIAAHDSVVALCVSHSKSSRSIQGETTLRGA